MSLDFCNKKFRRQGAFQENRINRKRASDIYECRKCRFTCPNLHLMVAHNVVHAREKIAVLEEENKLVDKPWFVPNETNTTKAILEDKKKLVDKPWFIPKERNTNEAVLEKVNKLVDKPSVFPKERNTAEDEIECVVDDIEHYYEIQKDQNQVDCINRAEHSDSDSNGSEVTRNLSVYDSDLDSDKDDPKIIDNKEIFYASQEITKYNDNDNENNSFESIDTNFVCFICDNVFQEESLYEDHVRVHTLSANLISNIPKFRFACEHCEFKSEDIDEFDLHKKSHYKSKTHTCKKCHNFFKTKLQLQKHYCKVQGKRKNSFKLKESQALRYQKVFQSKVNDVEKEFSCLICEKKCKTKGNLQLHMAIHSDKKPFHCTQCNYKSKWKTNLNIHMKKHLKTMKKSKKIVENGLIENLNIQKHMTVPSIENLFYCRLCNYKSKLKINLNVHMKRHHNKEHDVRQQKQSEKLSHCEFCNYKSKWKSNVKVHMKRRHNKEHNLKQQKKDEKPFHCKLCNYRSKWKGNLNVHMKRHLSD
ncbi:unnamed protein product [Meganyctiphanes norvegica]|uniref:C2H2-type domain-containing protein n=1 Tax=Meganyctiphanes norvegica TaxID=48144 RepID=A0AAV2R2D7_MEGNR